MRYLTRYTSRVERVNSPSFYLVRETFICMNFFDKYQRYPVKRYKIETGAIDSELNKRYSDNNNALNNTLKYSSIFG